MTLVRILQGVSGLDFSWAPGELVEMSEEDAELWVDGERAEPFDSDSSRAQLDKHLETLRQAFQVDAGAYSSADELIAEAGRVFGELWDSVAAASAVLIELVPDAGDKPLVDLALAVAAQYRQLAEATTKKEDEPMSDGQTQQQDPGDPQGTGTRAGGNVGTEKAARTSRGGGRATPKPETR